MEITEKLLESAKLLNRFLVPRYITGELLRFAEKENITKYLAEMKKFSLEEIIATLNNKKGYKLHDATRQKMILNLINLLWECGYINKAGDSYFWIGEGNGIDKEISLDEEERAALEDYFKNQVSFIEKCLGYAAAFLKGEGCLYGFDGDSLHVWDNFLGNIEFSFARQLLLLNMRIKNTLGFKLLDIGYGPGYGIISARELYPDIDITAIDFAGGFISLVKEKLDATLQPGQIRGDSTEPIKLMSNSMWRGFGHPLPFPGNSFNAVFFSCADPYVSYDRRESVYKEIYRILKHGGTLGVLTRSFPDDNFKLVKNPWTRRATYCHDFAESVCEGWHGFYGVEESFRLFKKIGFAKNKKAAHEISMLDSALWILDKD